MSSQEERDNFFNLTILLFRVGNQKLREYFKSQWPIVYEHVKPGTVPPPWQDTPHDAAEMKKIQPKKLNFSFKDEEIKFNSGNTNDWDFSLLTSVLKYSSLHFVLPSSPDEKALDVLKAIRNKLIGHATDAAIPNTVFNTAWTDACNALTLFNASTVDFKSVQDDVKKPLDVLYPMLQQCVKQEREIQDSVDTVINRIGQLQQTVERQHETLQQTVKKQHETLQQTVEKQHETQVEAVDRIERKVDQVLEQGQQGQKKSSTEVQSDSKMLKEAIEVNTQNQPKFLEGHDVTSAKTDDIFTNVSVYYADKTQEKKEQTKDLSREDQLRKYTKTTAGFKVKKCEDIFVDKERGNPKILLLTGKPGIGKKCFVRKSYEIGL